MASYIRSQWGNQAPEISEAKVTAAKKEFAGQKAQWTEADLMQIPADATLPDAGGGAAPAPTAPSAVAPAAAPAAAAPAPTAGAFDLKASIERGKPIYMLTCIACHQPTGMGIPVHFLRWRRRITRPATCAGCGTMLLKGVQGPLKVKEVTYNNIMLPLDVQFPILKDDSKLADVINYVRNSFGNQDPKGVTPELVGAARKEFAARTTPWTEAELIAFPAPAGK